MYKVTQRIFRKKDTLNLTRENKDKKRIRSQAWRRFMLGYPPRKKNDVSIGDAINWEWIVEVAQSNADSEIHIVSRDRDYGTHFEGQSFLNDWLLHEFRDRTSLKRKIHLSNRLSNTLKQLEVVVTPEEEEEETDLVKELAQFQAFKEKKYQERLARFKEYLETVRGESFSSTEE